MNNLYLKSFIRCERKAWLGSQDKFGRIDWRNDCKRSRRSSKRFISKGESWLTIGDGRYGTDANFIIRNGGKAHATDISDKLLKIGHEKGFIQDFSQQNAEDLNFKNNSTN